MADDARLLSLAVGLLQAVGVSAETQQAVVSEAVRMHGSVLDRPDGLRERAALRARLLAVWAESSGGDGGSGGGGQGMGMMASALHAAGVGKTAALGAGGSPSRKRRKTREPVRRMGDAPSASSTGGIAAALLDPLSNRGLRSPPRSPMAEELKLWTEDSMDGTMGMAGQIASYINQYRDMAGESVFAGHEDTQAAPPLAPLPGDDAAAVPGDDAVATSTSGSTSFDPMRPLPYFQTDGMLEALEQQPHSRKGLEQLVQMARQRNPQAFASPPAAAEAPGHPLASLEDHPGPILPASVAPPPAAPAASPAAPLGGDIGAAETHLAPSPAGIRPTATRKSALPLPDGIDIGGFLSKLQYGKGKTKAKSRPRPKSKR